MKTEGMTLFRSCDEFVRKGEEISHLATSSPCERMSFKKIDKFASVENVKIEKK
jgi:hypothetical protein